MSAWVGKIQSRTIDNRLVSRSVEIIIVLILLFGGAKNHFQLVANMLPYVVSAETRTEALAWLAGQPAFDDKTILLDSELIFSPLETKELNFEIVSLSVMLDSNSLALYKEMGVDIIVTSLRKIEDERISHIDNYYRDRAGNLPAISYADEYRERVRNESQLALDDDVVTQLIQIAEFAKTGHTSMLGTDFYFLIPPGVVTIQGNHVPVIINPEIKVFTLDE